jgi:formate hydrogenlyase subunit 3/multisubunit Na+/H+ antiporter MnhD subunit
MMGLPPFNGFISEWLTFQSLFANIAAGQAGLNILSILSAAALALAGGLAAACFVKLFGIAFLGQPRSESARNAKEVPVTMNIGMGLLALLCLAIGLFPLTILKLIDRVSCSLTGSSVFGKLHGGFIIAYYPLEIKGNSISTLGLLAVLAGIILISLIVLRIVGGKYIKRKYGTWDCGYEALTARMQYTATGFSKPLKIVFRMLYRPSRELKISGDLPYHPEKMEYSVASESIIEKHLYKPVTTFFKNLSRKTKYTVQTGSILRYLAYIFFVLVLLMLISLFV